ncbi:amidase family protein [Cupriavidus sp. KB_39]
MVIDQQEAGTGHGTAGGGGGDDWTRFRPACPCGALRRRPASPERLLALACRGARIATWTNSATCPYHFGYPLPPGSGYFFGLFACRRCAGPGLRRQRSRRTPVLPIPAHKHGVSTFLINGQTVDATYLQGATVPLNLTGLPGLSIRFGSSHDGMPINVQLVSSWQAGSTILHLAGLLERASQFHGLRPSL